MCRLFAVRADRPVSVRRAFAALRSLSHEHKDGWGVVHFEAGQPKLETSIDSAHLSERFSELGRGVNSHALMAHIRLASVGSVKPLNSHPFVADGWSFAHNGTLKQFAARQSALNALIDPRELAKVTGDTDSERCFALVRTRLGTQKSLEAVARTLVSVVRTASEIFDRDLPPGEKPSSMNFMISDGERLWCTRRGRTLFTASADGVRMIASDALWHDDHWDEVPEDSVIAIDEKLGVQRWRFDDLQP